MRFHEIADILPLMPQIELERLTNDIEVHGLKQPIMLHQGVILDGRARYLACEAIGKVPRFDSYIGGDPYRYVALANRHRIKHLDKQQRIAVANKLLDWKFDSCPFGKSNAIAYLFYWFLGINQAFPYGDTTKIYAPADIDAFMKLV